MYLSKIYIKNFRGIKELLVEFDKKLNVIIGANGQLKTSLMDAIRLFYSWGEPNRDIEITKEDFYVDITQNDDGTKTITPSTRIDICYQFEGLSAQQEGAFYQYLERKEDGTRGVGLCDGACWYIGAVNVSCLASLYYNPPAI